MKSFLFFLFFAFSIVESVGEGVTELAPGDHVLPVFTGECKECAHCKSEESNMCDLLRINVDRGVMIGDGKSRFSINGQPIFHFVGTSTFSEYTVIHVGCLAKINPEAPLDKVCVLSCGISTGNMVSQCHNFRKEHNLFECLWLLKSDRSVVQVLVRRSMLQNRLRVQRLRFSVLVLLVLL